MAAGAPILPVSTVLWCGNAPVRVRLSADNPVSRVPIKIRIPAARWQNAVMKSCYVPMAGILSLARAAAVTAMKIWLKALVILLAVFVNLVRTRVRPAAMTGAENRAADVQRRRIVLPVNAWLNARTACTGYLLPAGRQDIADAIRPRRIRTGRAFPIDLKPVGSSPPVTHKIAFFLGFSEFLEFSADLADLGHMGDP